MGVYLVINDLRQSTEALQFFSRMVIRKAVIENVSFTRFDSLFKKPQFVDAIFLDGEVHATFLSGILKSCPKLKILILLGEINGFLPDPITSRVSLMQLKSVDIRIAYSTATVILPYEEAKQACFNMMAFLKTLNAPNLETCCLDSWITSPFTKIELNEVLLEFLEIHPKLKGLLIYLRLEEKDFVGQMEVTEEEQNRLVPRLSLLGKQLQLSTCILSSIPYPNLWECFLREQMSMRTISFCDKTCQWGPCSIALRNNCVSLQVIYILMDIQSQLDFTIFAQCCNVKELILINTSTRDLAPGAPLDVVSLNKLLHCENLHFLALSNLIASREDLWKLTELKSLDALALLSSGFGYNTGVNLELLRHYLSCRKLKALLIDGTVAFDQEEANKIFEIMRLTAEGDGNRRRSEMDNNVETSIINIRPLFSDFQQWTPNPQGDGFLFNMEFDHHDP